MDKKLLLGLDLGSDSVGWALTDENYNLARLKGKDAWGVRRFEKAEDCSKRRTFRCNRRRLGRRKYRIGLLQSLFAEEMKNIDDTFFLRLNESNLHLEDKSSKNAFKHPLFKDKQAEKKYNTTFPTIWHLRKSLIYNDTDYDDLRKVYLAIHHIIKYRGNFLKEGQVLTVESFDRELFSFINQAMSLLSEDGEYVEILSFSESKNLLSILIDEHTNINEKKKKLSSLIHTDDKTILTLFATLLVGAKYNFKELLESENDIKIDFRTDDEEKYLSVLEELGNYIDVVKGLKAIYDFVVVKKLLSHGEDNFLSSSMVDIYENHKMDLSILKEEIKTVDNYLNLSGTNRYYYKIFKAPNIVNYHSLVLSQDKKKSSIADFNKYIIKIIDEIGTKVELTQNLIDIKNKCADEKFLTKISINSTSVIPYQLHKKELDIILSKINKFFPKIDTQKIEQIFLFKIPYYVGPLNDKSPYATIVRKSYEKITPWNFEEIVDFRATREKFMNSRTNKCLYLLGEDVLPKASLLYQEYMVLDKINCIKIDGNLVDLPTRNIIFNDLCKQHKEVSKKSIINKLFSLGLTSDKDNTVIAGIDEKMTCSLSSYIYFKDQVGLDCNKDHNFIEDAIRLATLYVDDVRPAKSILQEKYPQVDEKIITKSLNVPTAGYGAFSKKFLAGIAYDDDVCNHSIIDLMRNNVMNLFQVLSNQQFNFEGIIKYENGSKQRTTEEIIKEKMEMIPTLVRKSVNQSVLIIDELIRFAKKDISTIFIEVTRKNDKKPLRSTSRKQQILEFYQSITHSDEYYDQMKEMEEILNSIQEEKINSEAVYLYFLQLGYDVYTGEKITSLEEALDASKYDIDHIIPQSILKNDSLENKVLVSRFINQRVKGNLYPLPDSIRFNHRVTELWKFLKSKKKFSDEKYASLIRTDPLSENEINAFINRQLTVLNYSNTCLKEIIEIKYPKTKVVFSRARFVSNFKNMYGIVKNRGVNNHHHAIDAYLNVVVGDVIDKTYIYHRKDIVKKLLRQDKEVTLNFMRVFETPFNDYWNNDAKKDRVLKISEKSSVLSTYKSITKTGELYKETIYSAKKSNTIPTHTKSPLKDVSKYGGYSSLSFAFLSVIKILQKGKETQMLYAVPLIDYLDAQRTNTPLVEFIKLRLNVNEVEIQKDKVLFYQKMRLGKTRVMITAKTGNQLSLALQEELLLSKKSNVIINNCNRFEMKVPRDFSGDSLDFIVNRDGDKIVLSKQDMRFVFEELIGQKENAKYSSLDMLLGYLIKLSEAKHIFESLNLKNQIAVINQILTLFDNTRQMADLTLLNLGEDKNFFKLMGNYAINRDITGKHLTIINESVTGLIAFEEKL